MNTSEKNLLENKYFYWEFENISDSQKIDYIKFNNEFWHRFYHNNSEIKFQLLELWFDYVMKSLNENNDLRELLDISKWFYFYLEYHNKSKKDISKKLYNTKQYFLFEKKFWITFRNLSSEIKDELFEIWFEKINDFCEKNKKIAKNEWLTFIMRNLDITIEEYEKKLEINKFLNEYWQSFSHSWEDIKEILLSIWFDKVKKEFDSNIELFNVDEIWARLFKKWYFRKYIMYKTDRKKFIYLHNQELLIKEFWKSFWALRPDKKEILINDWYEKVMKRLNEIWYDHPSFYFFTNEEIKYRKLLDWYWSWVWSYSWRFLRKIYKIWINNFIDKYNEHSKIIDLYSFDEKFINFYYSLWLKEFLYTYEMTDEEFTEYISEIHFSMILKRNYWILDKELIDKTKEIYLKDQKWFTNEIKEWEDNNNSFKHHSINYKNKNSILWFILNKNWVWVNKDWTISHSFCWCKEKFTSFHYQLFKSWIKNKFLCSNCFWDFSLSELLMYWLLEDLEKELSTHFWIKCHERNIRNFITRRKLESDFYLSWLRTTIEVDWCFHHSLWKNLEESNKNLENFKKTKLWWNREYFKMNLCQSERKNFVSFFDKEIENDSLKIKNIIKSMFFEIEWREIKWEIKIKEVDFNEIKENHIKKLINKDLNSKFYSLSDDDWIMYFFEKNEKKWKILIKNIVKINWIKIKEFINFLMKEFWTNSIIFEMNNQIDNRNQFIWLRKEWFKIKNLENIEQNVYKLDNIGQYNYDLWYTILEITKKELN